MEDFLGKALLQSGLGAIGVIVLFYILRELTLLQKKLEKLTRRVNRINEKVSVLLYAQGVNVPQNGEDDDD
jgi:hypothetical protein